MGSEWGSNPPSRTQVKMQVRPQIGLDAPRRISANIRRGAYHVYVLYTTRTIPTTVKAAVVERDGLVCRWCGTVVVRGGTRADCFRPDYLHFDHVHPWGSGGDHTVDNLVVSCARCNLGREKPRINLRFARDWVTYHHGRYWWPEDYIPPRLIDESKSAMLLAEVVTRRLPVLEIVRLIHRGEYAATGQGEPIYVQTPIPEPERRRRRLD